MLETASVALERHFADTPLVAVLRWITPEEAEAIGPDVVKAWRAETKQ